MKTGKIAFGLAACLLAGGAYAESAPTKSPVVASKLSLMNVPLDVADLERASNFYIKGLGLTFGTRLNKPDMTEQILVFPAGTAGLNLIQMKNPGDKTPAVTPGRVTLAVPDLAALAERLQAAGYELQGPIVDIAQYHVRVAHVLDPDGNDLELVQLPH